MNKIALVLFVLLLISCNAASHRKISIDNLKESFASKDDSEFMYQFPKKMVVFKSYFGWNEDLDQPEELYEESYQYIDYWFNLLNKEQFRDHEEQIVQICEDGKWQADGVNYFQDRSLNYIKEKGKYDLINNLDDSKAKSVLFFLFDSPHPSIDTVFAAHLNEDKKKLLIELEQNYFKDHKEVNEKSDWITYKNNDDYFVRDVDVNGDNITDKVVSNRAYKGDELVIFINTNNTYTLALKTTNFSEDGGCQIVDVKKDKEGNGFVLSLAFMGGGFLEEDYHIAFKEKKRWELTHTVYRTKSGNHEGAEIYECDVKQEVDLSDPNLFEKLNRIPDEEDRKMNCVTIKSN